MEAGSGEITRLLVRLKSGDARAQNELFSLVYDELRRLAAIHMAKERGDHTLQATALVNEVFLKLSGGEVVDWQSRAHFFGVASKTMRRILIDHARSFNAQKRFGKQNRITLETALVYSEEQSGELLALDEALHRLEKLDPRQCRTVELRFFGGLSVEESAEVLGVSVRTVKRDWTMARAWLHAELEEGAPR